MKAVHRVNTIISLSQHKSSLLSKIGVAVVQPEYAINLGYLGRTIANFGIERLFVVGEIDQWKIDLDKAAMFASHGHRIIENLRRTESLEQLRRKFRILIGTTAIQGRRKSNITRKTLDVADCAQRVAELVSRKRNNDICIVFGRDTTGLTNEELQKCDYNLTIRTGSDYNTLNISHAAAIVFYSFQEAVKYYRMKGSALPQDKSSSNLRSERDRVIRLFDELAAVADFQEFKRRKLTEAVSRLLNRSDPSLRELYLLMGVTSKAVSHIKRFSPSTHYNDEKRFKSR